MASLVLLICTVLSLTNLVFSATTKPHSMYDKITEKCPRLKEDPNYCNQTLFQYCTTWMEIEKAADERSLLCLLYYDTFVNYCTQIKSINTTISTNILNINDVCHQLTNISKTVKLEHESVISKINLTECTKICQGDLGMAKTICVLSYNLLNITLSVNKLEKPPKPVENSEISKLTNNKEQEIDTKPESVRTILGQTNTKISAVAINVSTPAEISPAINSTKNDIEIAIKNNLNEIPAEGVVNSIRKSTVIKPEESKLPINNATQVIKEQVIATSAEVKKKVPVPINSNVNLEQGQDQIEQSSNNDKVVEDESPYIQAPSNNINIDDDIKGKKYEEADDANDDRNLDEVKAEVSKPQTLDESVNYNSEIDGDSYFFSYFMILCCIFIIGYVGYHNKQKILALILEGRRGKRQYRSRRPNSANYHKLDSNLEEAISSSCSKDVSNVIY